MGLPIEEQIQDDWKIFNLAPNDTLRFFHSSVPSHPLLAALTRVKLRAVNDQVDHLATWTEFATEIKARNRFFPKQSIDLQVLESAFRSRQTMIRNDATLYRARVTESPDRLTPDQLGAPPADRAKPGRANPVGIPHLYLAFSEETCIYETRVSNHATVAIGEFDISRELKVLDLANIEHPDFFDDDDSFTKVLTFRYLRALGNELSKPVRPSDSMTDYIPTQYICDYAKWLGYDGVLYSSSLHAGGKNLVLFDVGLATCKPNIKTVTITELTARWE